jgi:methyl-accepting chemotaxis protein
LSPSVGREPRLLPVAIHRVIEGVQDVTLNISGVVDGIESISGAISDSVGQQQYASQKIAENVGGAAERTRLVSSTIAGVSDFAKQTRQGVEQILDAVAGLNRQAGTLQRGAEQFANRMRAV